MFALVNFSTPLPEDDKEADKYKKTGATNLYHLGHNLSGSNIHSYGKLLGSLPNKYNSDVTSGDVEALQHVFLCLFVLQMDQGGVWKNVFPIFSHE